MSRVGEHYCAEFNECSRSGFCVELPKKIYKCICLSPFEEPNCTFPTTTQSTPVAVESTFNFNWIFLIAGISLMVIYFAYVGIAKYYHRNDNKKTWAWAFGRPFQLLWGLLLAFILLFKRDGSPTDDTKNAEGGKIEKTIEEKTTTTYFVCVDK